MSAVEREQYVRMHAFEERNWWFRLKRDLVYGLLARSLETAERPRIVDVGSGTGIVLAQLPMPAVAVGFELDRDALLLSRGRGLTRLAQARATALPADSGCFDAVLALDVIEHLDDDAGALAEMHRVLRPGGVLVLNVPAHPFLWSPHDEVLHHRRRYTRSRLRDVVLRAGFTLESLTYGFATVFPLACFVRLARRWLGSRRSTVASDDFVALPGVVETLLYAACAWERPLVQAGWLPFGLSLLAAGRKSDRRNVE